jgi:aspartate 1-decarboxylase
MLRKMLRAKIHRATVTDANLEYVGSLTIDRDLMDAAGIAEWEAVLVSDLNNGSRHETYAIAGPRGSGIICANGAAAHLVKPGDKVIVMCFGLLNEQEIQGHRPRIVLVDEQNRLSKMLQT